MTTPKVPVRRARTVILERRLPDGTVRGLPEPMPRRRACISVASCLLDNGVVRARRDADRAAAAVDDAPDGAWVDAPGGYAFRLREAPR